MTRFKTPSQGSQFPSEYDLPSDEILDIQNRGVSPVRVIENIDLSVSGTLLVRDVGKGFVFYARDLSTGEVYPEASLDIFVNAEDGTDSTRRFPAKPNRGFVGSFQSLFVKWNADVSGTYKITLVIFKSDHYPWTGGEESV